MEFQIITPTMRSPEDLARIRRVREMTALIRLPGDPPAAPAPRRSAPPPRPPAPATSNLPATGTFMPAATPAARAYAQGVVEARRDALAVIAVCTEFGRPDLVHQMVGLHPAAARAFVIDSMWGDAITKARSTASWMVR